MSQAGTPGLLMSTSSGTFMCLPHNVSVIIFYLIYTAAAKKYSLSASLIQIRNAVRQTHLNSKQFKLIHAREGRFCGYVRRQKSGKQIQTFSLLQPFSVTLRKDSYVQTIEMLENTKYNLQTCQNKQNQVYFLPDRMLMNPLPHGDVQAEGDTGSKN